MGLKELSGGKRKDVFLIDPNLLKIDPEWNVRQHNEDMDEHVRFLADSIKAVGVRVPLIIRMKDDVPVVVDGECRLLATLLAISEGADIKAIPVMAEDRYANDGDRVISMITCNEGRPLTILEQAAAYKRLIAWGWSEAKIASETGYSITHVKSALNLSTASPEILTMVATGQVAPSLAIQQIAKNGQNGAVETLKKAVERSTAQGKKHATAKHLHDSTANSGKKHNWNKWGPMLFQCLEAICNCPEKSAKFGDCLARANELIQKMEDERGKG